MDKHLQEKGFTRSIKDPCIYYIKGQDIIISVYVDDLLFYGTPEEIKLAKSAVGSKFDTKDLGEVSHILSLQVKRNKIGISLSQSTYAKHILEELNMDNSRSVKTPLPLGTKFSATDNHNRLTKEYASKYRTAVGHFQYLATGTRPDLAFTATYLGKFGNDPSDEHWTGVKHTLRYLRGTIDYKLLYKRTGKTVEAYSDADFGSDLTDGRSFSGYVISLAGGAISWRCRKQPTAALSTTEAEFMALGETTRECNWMKHFIEEINQQSFIRSTVLIHADNQAAIKLSQNYSTTDRTKHMRTQFFQLRDNIADGSIKINYISTNENVADALTKIISLPKMLEHLNKIQVFGGSVN